MRFPPTPRRGPAAAGLLLAAVLAPAASADALHPGAAGAWRHEFSGWLFPLQVAGLRRAQPPVNLDGNDDAAARYTATGVPPAMDAEVAVYFPASPAAGASLPQARASLLAVAPASAAAESSFVIPGHGTLQGLRIVLRDAGGHLQLLYFVRHPQWTLTVRASAVDEDRGAAQLDDFVQALPWHSLGSEDRLH